MSKGLSVVVCNLYSSNTTTRQNISHSIPQIICYIVVLKVLKLNNKLKMLKAKDAPLPKQYTNASVLG